MQVQWSVNSDGKRDKLVVSCLALNVGSASPSGNSKSIEKKRWKKKKSAIKNIIYQDKYWGSVNNCMKFDDYLINVYCL